MISVSKDHDGKIIGYVEWRQVGPSGFDKYLGEYVWVADMWVHPDFRGGTVFAELIEKILIMAKEAKYAYFTHRKYNDRMSRLYTREQFEKLIQKKEIHSGV